jgi:hypothetical protein
MQVYKDHNGLIVNNFEQVPQDKGHLYHVFLAESTACVSFQRGPVPNHGVNGLTNECLLAILIHRTRFINDQFPCEENRMAIEHMEKALQSFNDRTNNRIARGVEGKNLL